MRVVSVGFVAVLLAGLHTGVSAAAPNDPIIAAGKVMTSPASSEKSSIVDYRFRDKRNVSLLVHSAAMDRDVTINVQRPADPSRPRPVLYLLNGAGGGMDAATWKKRTDVLKFLSDKDVNVVQPVGGKWSYYTDWRAPDPELGVNKWKTFFTEELPPLLDSALKTSGVNALAGLSTSGTSVLQLAEAKPGLYKSVAAYSGCAQISDPLGYRFVKLAVETWGGGDTKNMYGPEGDPMWAANDPYVNAEKLRGINLFISTGTGAPGMYDTFGGKFAMHGVTGLANQLVVGGVIEAATNWCSHNLQAKLEHLHIPANYDFQPSGTHSWGYWQDALRNSWPVLARGIHVS